MGLYNLRLDSVAYTSCRTVLRIRNWIRLRLRTVARKLLIMLFSMLTESAANCNGESDVGWSVCKYLFVFICFFFWCFGIASCANDRAMHHSIANCLFAWLLVSCLAYSIVGHVLGWFVGLLLCWSAGLLLTRTQ